jgi:hypothetical protein
MNIREYLISEVKKKKSVNNQCIYCVFRSDGPALPWHGNHARFSG